MLSLPPKVSVILITYNEEENISQCLSSVQWADEIIVVDSHSKDNTVKIANTYERCKVISAAWKGFVPAKQLAVENTTNDWVLWIDADERVTPELQEEIIGGLEMSSSFVAFDIPRKTFFMNQWIKPWYPGRVTRLFNKQHCTFNNNILHEGLEINEPARLGHFKSDLLHYSYNSLHQYFSKMNMYGKYGAEELVRRKKKFQSWKLLLNPFSTFIQFYFFKKGFLLGKSGFILAVGSAYSNFIKYANFYYLVKDKKF
ncbi:MAG: glycosyltransferase family 2 protein [Cytophagaceae bacterium]|jgi:(heptosyl)LPS beta-1,4-glucosyltransferase|nr:glycosyltransferase family 2 protein [Cytophagaceae bacterium]